MFEGSFSPSLPCTVGWDLNFSLLLFFSRSALGGFYFGGVSIGGGLLFWFVAESPNLDYREKSTTPLLKLWKCPKMGIFLHFSAF